VFAEIDRDASGAIDRTELAQALRLLRVDVSGSDLDDLFARYDGDGNGRLNYKVL
jgi:Ca2+-binding EF-hand superfamily protein